MLKLIHSFFSKNIVLTFSFVILSFTAIAQPPLNGKFEVSGSIATISGMYIFNSFNSDDHAAVDYGHESYDYMVSGRYFLSKHIALGLDIDYQTLDITTNSFRTTASFTGYQALSTIAPAITAVYVNTGFFQFYSTYGIGIEFYKNHYTTYTGSDTNIPNSGIRCNLDATPLGFRVGRSFAWHLEFGLGYRGLLNTGFNYSFGKTHSHIPAQ